MSCGLVHISRTPVTPLATNNTNFTCLAECGDMLAHNYDSINKNCYTQRLIAPAVVVPSALLINIKPPPPMFPAPGQVTASAKPTATAASTALPPRVRISTPIFEAISSDEATMPCRARTGEYARDWLRATLQKDKGR